MLGEVVEKNAVITSARLSTADHGVLSGWLQLDYGGSGQGFGGYALYAPIAGSEGCGPMGKNYAGHWIWRVLEVVGVENWDDLPRTPVRVRASHNKVVAIGHIIEDRWFEPGAEVEQIKEGVYEPAEKT